jgi:hypothetical protein
MVDRDVDSRLPRRYRDNTKGDGWIALSVGLLIAVTLLAYFCCK